MAEAAKNLFAEILRMIVDPLRTKFQGNWNFRLRRPLRKQRAAKDARSRRRPRLVPFAGLGAGPFGAPQDEGRWGF
jgi:hypothetical protein